MNKHQATFVIEVAEEIKKLRSQGYRLNKQQKAVLCEIATEPRPPVNIQLMLDSSKISGRARADMPLKDRDVILQYENPEYYTTGRKVLTKR